MNINKDIKELLKAQIITPETAADIQAYYQSRKANATNRLFVIFGILGALLIGLGIILIFAHNWDTLPRLFKTGLTFLLLFIAQLICGYAITKKSTSIAWRESSTVFLFLIIGATIALIGQIYHLPGNLGRFLLTWMLLGLPLVYLAKSSISSILYIIGITAYACEIGYWMHPVAESWLYWILLLAIIPHFIILIRNYPESGFLTLHKWLLPLSPVITLGTIASNNSEFMFVAYISMFGLYHIIGNTLFNNEKKAINNAFTLTGILGTLSLLLTLSFDWFWNELQKGSFHPEYMLISREGITAILVTIFAIVLKIFAASRYKKIDLSPFSYAFILFFFIFLAGMATPSAVFLINLLLFAMGLGGIIMGAKNGEIQELNLGLLVISALIICRFFDTEFSFVTRGIVFVLIGSGFFTANYWMLKKRKANA